jgi:hypothetical protein
MENAHTTKLSEHLKSRDHFEDTDADERILLKLILTQDSVRV